MKTRRGLWAACLMLVAVFGVAHGSYAQQSGQINVGGQVPGAPPSQPAVITNPTNGQHFDHDIIDVSGTCTPFVTVEIYSNNIFVGSAPCLPGGTFSLQVQLVPGTNVLIAKQRDSLDQYGPDSQPVEVTYDKPVPVPRGPSTGLPGGTAATPVAQADLFRLLTDVVYRGGQTNQSVLIKIEILGGIRPYAVGIDWGDGVYELVSRSEAGTFGQGHVYSKPGQYTIKIKGRDKAGNSAYIQTYTIVTGKAAAVDEPLIFGPGRLEKVVNQVWRWTWWILLLLVVFMGGYKLGRRRDKRLKVKE